MGPRARAGNVLLAGNVRLLEGFLTPSDTGLPQLEQVMAAQGYDHGLARLPPLIGSARAGIRCGHALSA
jgi:hypothetical protein